MSAAASARWYEFGAYRLDPNANVVFREKERLRLTPKAVETLRVLIEHAGDVVPTDLLMREVWPATFVEEGSITRNISDLRKALGNRGHIETVPKRGYRFIAPVRRSAIEDRQPYWTVEVLPFDMLIKTRGRAELGLGIANTLVVKLAAIPGCAAQLVSREPAAVTGNGVTKKRRNADLTVHGTLQFADSAVRLGIKFIDSDHRTVWSESLEYDLEAESSIEEISAEELAGAVALWLGKRHRKLLVKRYARNAEAYKLYLTGHYHASKRSKPGLDEALHYFRAAVEQDRDYALAYAALAAANALMPMLAPVDAGTYMSKAKIAALDALEMDETLADARAALAFVKWHYEWDWAGAEREFRRILSLRPDDALTRQWLALLLAEQRRFTEAIVQAAKAKRLDASSASTRANVATVLLFAGRHDRAEEEARYALSLDPASVRAHWVIAGIFLSTGKPEAALDVLQHARERFPASPALLGSLGHCLGAAGRHKDASEILRQIDGLPHPNAWSYAKALTCLGMDKVPECLHWLEQARSGHDFQLVLLNVDQRLDRIRRDPRFQTFAKSLGLATARA